MIRAEKQKQALSAIHQIVLLGRFSAYHNDPTAKIAKILDYAEILVDAFSSNDDRTDEFRIYLQGFASEFERGIGILKGFDQ